MFCFHTNLYLECGKRCTRVTLDITHANQKHLLVRPAVGVELPEQGNMDKYMVMSTKETFRDQTSTSTYVVSTLTMKTIKTENDNPLKKNINCNKDEDTGIFAEVDLTYTEEVKKNLTIFQSFWEKSCSRRLKCIQSGENEQKPQATS